METSPVIFVKTFFLWFSRNLSNNPNEDEENGGRSRGTSEFLSTRSTFSSFEKISSKSTHDCRRNSVKEWGIRGGSSSSSMYNNNDEMSRRQWTPTESRLTERTRTPVSLSSCYLLIVLALLGMCQVSEECPAVCECKWKSGKESVICANAKTKLTEIPSGLDPGTQVLDISGNSIKALPSNVFLSLNLLNLQKIFLSECSLKSLDRLAFAKLTNLVELDLSGNRQEFIPSHAFGEIPELRELKINSNPISRLSNDAFVHLGRLIRLELSGCRIGTIEIWAFRGLPALEWLRLDNNRLLTVQAISFFPLRSLHGLEIHGNPWNCSCALQPFRQWMGKNNVPFGVPPVCSQPPRLAGKLWNELELEDFACLPKLHSTNRVKSRKILEGENTTLTCQWEATPDTKIRWWNGNKPVGTSGASGFSSGFLVSESFTWEPDDSSSRSDGSSTSRVTSAVGATAQIPERSSALLVLGKPGRNHTFFDRGVGIKISTLMMIRSTPRDAGTYSCKAESRAGSVTANFTLIVLQNKAEHLTGRFLLFGAVLAALLTLVVSLLLVCVVFGSSRRHYHPSRIATDDKLELNHVGGTHILGQNGGGSVPLMGNHHNSHRHNSSNHGGTNVTANSVLSRRSMSNGENNCADGGSNDKGREYKAIPTTEPDDSSSDLENNGSDQEDGEADQDGAVAVVSTTTTAIVSSRSQSHTRNGNGPHQTMPQHLQQQQELYQPPPNPLVSSTAAPRHSSGKQVLGETSHISHITSPQPRNELLAMGQNANNSGGPAGSSNRSSIKSPGDKYPDLIDEKMSLSSDFASLPRANKNQQQQQQQQQQQYQLPYKHYTHQKQHLVDTRGGYFHRRNNSDSQSPLLSRSYGNSTDKITSSGISILSSSSTESSYVSSYHQPYTIGQSHHPPHYRGSFKGSSATHFQQPQNHNPFISTYTNYPTRQRLSMPTSPVHDHYFVEPGTPSVGALRHHSGSHDEGRNGLLSPSEQGISYVRTANSGPVSSASNNGCYDYHAAQLAAFLEEYRQLQLELMRMSASLQQQGSNGASSSSSSQQQQQQSINSPPSASSSLGNSNSMTTSGNSKGNHDLSTNVNNAAMLYKTNSPSHPTHGNSPQQHQLKSILKNSGNNNNYVA
ncbi:unnamed protein product [Orchesella dallaii]|uniref:Ig-like domain-containing protein n=1 Tax=Orchesella dallaii TaxID=48710 RepID=A0ABP1PX93_9HEXA